MVTPERIFRMVLSLEDRQSWRTVGTTVLGVYVVYRLGRKIQHKIMQKGLYKAIQARQQSCAQTLQTVGMQLGKSNVSCVAIIIWRFALFGIVY